MTGSGARLWDTPWLLTSASAAGASCIHIRYIEIRSNCIMTGSSMRPRQTWWFLTPASAAGASCVTRRMRTAVYMRRGRTALYDAVPGGVRNLSGERQRDCTHTWHSLGWSVHVWCGCAMRSPVDYGLVRRVTSEKGVESAGWNLDFLGNGHTPGGAEGHHHHSSQSGPARRRPVARARGWRGGL